MKSNHHEMAMTDGHYGRLATMGGLSFLAMYALMYAMVDSLPNVIPNYNQFYMAGLMASPMIVIELALMGKMYPNKRLNFAIIFGSIIATVMFFMLIRGQVGIGDQQFLKSMIPHHGGAVLMCDKANLTDSEIKTLCTNILQGQQAEINQMKAILERLR